MTKKATTQSTSKQAKKAGVSLLSPNDKVTITLTKAEVTKNYQQQLVKLARQVKVAGFRQGKVPLKVAEEQLGQAKIIEYVLDELLPQAYRQAVQQAKKTPITHPEFKVVSAKVGEEWTIEAEFAQLPTVKLTNYQAHVKTGLKEATKALATPAKVDKTKPAQTEPKTPPPPVDEKQLKLQHIFKALVLELKPQVPEMLLKHETQHEFEHLVGQLKQLNITVDDYLQRRQSNMDQLSQELAIQTLNRLQLDLVLGAIAKEEKLEVTAKDRTDYFAQIEDPKQREQLSQDSHYLSHLDTNLIKQKVVDHLLAL